MIQRNKLHTLFFVGTISPLILFLTTVYKNPTPLTLELQNVFEKENVVPVIIIGSGPAGLSAAAIIARAGIKVLVITGKELGGQLTEAKIVENLPGKKKMTGAQAMDGFKKQALNFGARLLYDTVERVDFTSWPFKIWTEDNNLLHALAVIIATGGIPRKLALPGVAQYWGKGIGYCSICDAPFNTDQNVAIVGNSDYAIDQATQVAAFAKKVIIITSEDHLNTSASMQEHLRETPNISVLSNTELTNILGDDHKLTAIEIKDNRTNRYKTLPIQGLYFAMGYDPNSALFKDTVDCTPQGYIKVSGINQKTSIPGVFAAGTVEIEDPAYQKAVVASGRGSAAALGVIEFLQELKFTPQAARDMQKNFFEPKQFATGTIEEISSLEDLKQRITKDKYLIIDFFADFCPFCQQISPLLESLAHQYAGRVTFLKVDTDKSRKITADYSIKKIPTLLLFKNGVPFGRSENPRTHKEIENLVKKLISSQ